MKPTFTVVTVHYNQIHLLKPTVENVLEQEGFGIFIEYIIVDGISNDGTIQYLHNLPAKNNIQLIIERDKGIYDAMNKAINLAKGDYIIFLNAGDTFCDENTLATLKNEVKDADVYYGDTSILFEGYIVNSKAKALNQFWKSLPFVHQSALIKSTLAKNNLFDLSYKYCADYNQLANLYHSNFKFNYLPKTIAQITAGGTSDINRTKATKEVFKISKRIFKLGFFKKLFFRFKMVKGKFALFLKKLLPKKTVKKITQYKHK